MFSCHVAFPKLSDQREQYAISCNVFCNLLFNVPHHFFHVLLVESESVSSELRMRVIRLYLWDKVVSKNLWTLFKTITEGFLFLFQANSSTYKFEPILSHLDSANLLCSISLVIVDPIHWTFTTSLLLCQAFYMSNLTQYYNTRWGKWDQGFKG
jgi:hypothetical protein